MYTKLLKKIVLFAVIVFICFAFMFMKERNRSRKTTSNFISFGRHAGSGVQSTHSATEFTISDVEKAQMPSPSTGNGLAKRLPTTIIIGFSKCGTDALRTFLYLHPRIVAKDGEVDFFTKEYSRGFEWYRQQMPDSLPNQITIEKTPVYIWSKRAIQRMYDFNPALKLIVLVRDPIVRVQSHYARAVWRNESFNASFTDWVEMVEKSTIIDSLLRLGDYAQYIRDVFRLFDKRQVLILDGEMLSKEPVRILQECEKFLEIEPVFKDNLFVFKKEKGFFCINMKTLFFQELITSNSPIQVNMDTGCLGASKGREHPDVPEAMFKHLIDFYRPTTEDLFQLIGTRFEWHGFQKDDLGVTFQ